MAAIEALAKVLEDDLAGAVPTEPEGWREFAAIAVVALASPQVRETRAKAIVDAWAKHAWDGKRSLPSRCVCGAPTGDAHRIDVALDAIEEVDRT